MRQERAINQYHIIEAELAVLPNEAKEVSFHSNFNADTNEAVIYLDKVPDFPSSWSLLASEAFFNIRAALDYLAWELARWNLQQQGKTRNPHGSTQFPITTRPELFKKEQVRDLHPDHRAEVERLQPYGHETLSKYSLDRVRPENWHLLAQKTPLAKLKLINDHDKHRLLRPIGSSIMSASVGDAKATDCEIVGAGHPMGQLHKGAQWSVYRVRPMGPNPKVEVRDWVVPDVAFGDFNFLAEFPGVFKTVGKVIERFADVFPPEA